MNPQQPSSVELGHVPPNVTNVRASPYPKLVVDVDTGDAWLDGKRLVLSARLGVVLTLLVKAQGRTVTCAALCAACEEDALIYARRIIGMTIYRLRKILGRDSIATRYGVGYVLLIPAEVVQSPPG